MIPDILIVGAGVFGMSAAFAAHRAGLSVKVVEADRPGAGASGGIVGALTPHAPTRWRPMMAFQFAALQSLEARCVELQDQTGIDTGYGRIGRAVPLASVRALERAEADIAAAPQVWPTGQMRLSEMAPDGAAPEIAEHGWVYDDISARLSPRRMIDALCAVLPPDAITSAEVTSVVPGVGVETRQGPLSAGAVVLAGGWRGWSLLPAPLQGSGVKGQAALLSLDLPNLPVITHDGLYVIPHRDGTVAVGSTSEKRWTSDGGDGAVDELIARAACVVPELAQAPAIERWAGIRPKPPGREPVVGPIPGLERVWVAGGGFRIGFGIAHAVGDAVIAMIMGQSPTIPVPQTFLPSAHYDAPAGAPTSGRTAPTGPPEQGV